MRDDGLIRHLGFSNATTEQAAEAQSITLIVCGQNVHNLALRGDDTMLDERAADGVAYVAFFQLGGFTPLQAAALSAVAARRPATPTAVALAWLLQRSPDLRNPGHLVPRPPRGDRRRSRAHLNDQVLSDLGSIAV